MRLKILCIIERSAWDGAKEQTYLFVREMSKYHNIELAINEKFTRMVDSASEFAKIHFFEKYSKIDLRFNINNYIRLYKIVNENDYDLIITQSSLAMQYVGIIHPWLQRKTRKKLKIIAVKRGDTIPNIVSRNLKYRIANEIVLVSQHVRAMLEKHKSHKQKLQVIESGVDTSLFFPGDDKAQIRKELGFTPDNEVYINVANWDLNRKRQDIILQAFSKLACKNSRLILVGVGTDSTEAISKAASYGISDQVHCLGFRTDVPDLLRAADFFVMSSKSEGIAGSLLQAMACGKVVLATKAGGIAEYLMDEVNGFATEINDIDTFESRFSSLILLTNIERKELAKSAMETAQKYSLDNNIKQWLKLIDDVLIKKY